MRAQIHYPAPTFVIIGMCTALLMFSGVASAQGTLNKELALVEGIFGSDDPLTKDEQKCVNTSNKNAQKIADAQGKNYNSCIKDFAKGKNGSADACVAADAKGKVSKAEGKYDSKTAKDCTAGSGFMVIADNATVKAAAKDKETSLLEMIFGTDGGIDGAILDQGTDKDDSKCQIAIVKAALKCQATKWKEYNKCKKNKIKGKDTTQATSAQEVQDECTGVGAGSIPDAKGKIAKKCDFSSTITKKCPNNVFPGCPGDNAALNACLDAFVECKWCLANNTIDGLNRDCDLFDDGLANGSCTTCGNGTLEVGEECDDGNTLNGDGCSAECELECAHDKCVIGVALDAGCDPCVQQICDVDSFCCVTSWDSDCIGEVVTVCGLACD